MQSRPRLSTFLRGTILGALIVAAIGAIFNPIANHFVNDMFRNTLDTSLSEPTRLPIELKEAIICVDDIARIAHRLEQDPDTIFPSREGTTEVDVTGGTLRQCSDIIRYRHGSGYPTRNLIISNENDVSASDVTLFSSDADYMVRLDESASIKVISSSEMEKGYLLGDIPPDTSLELMIGGNLFSNIFIESSFGQDVVQIKSFLDRWGFLLAGVVFGILITVTLLFGSAIESRARNDSNSSAKTDDNDEAS